MKTKPIINLTSDRELSVLENRILKISQSCRLFNLSISKTSSFFIIFWGFFSVDKF